MSNSKEAKKSKNNDNRIKELEKELEQAVNLSEKRLNDLKYMQADLENLRKHFDKEKKQLTKLANKKLVQEILPVLDDFKSVLEQSNDEGVQMIYDKLMKALNNIGLEKVESVGKKFDSDVHEVVSTKEGEEDVVLTEVSSGYKLNGNTIRTAKVVVGKEKEKIGD